MLKLVGDIQIERVVELQDSAGPQATSASDLLNEGANLWIEFATEAHGDLRGLFDFTVGDWNDDTNQRVVRSAVQHQFRNRIELGNDFIRKAAPALLKPIDNGQLSVIFLNDVLVDVDALGSHARNQRRYRQ